jgi:hypothetical protein
VLRRAAAKLTGQQLFQKYDRLIKGCLRLYGKPLPATASLSNCNPMQALQLLTPRIEALNPMMFLAPIKAQSERAAQQGMDGMMGSLLPAGGSVLRLP